jgi:glycopeptide antibiotics resistance protein
MVTPIGFGRHALVRSLSIAAFSAYLFLLLSLVWAYRHPGYREVAYRYNLTPFHSIARDVPAGGRGLWVNIIGNIVVFAPVGLAVRGFRGPRSFGLAVLASAALSTLIEVVQFQSGRRFSDVDDVILNTLGGVAGYAAAVAIAGFRADERPARTGDDAAAAEAEGRGPGRIGVRTRPGTGA